MLLGIVVRQPRQLDPFPQTFPGHKARDWETQAGDDAQSVAGNIHKKGQFWRDTLKAPKFVQNIIDNGYRIPLKEPCPPFVARNNASSRNNPQFVKEAIEKLLANGCIEEVDEVPYCCNPLTVAGKGEKLRLVLDLRHVNDHLTKHKFPYENLKTVEKMFEPGFHFANFDLKSG